MRTRFQLVAPMLLIGACMLALQGCKKTTDEELVGFWHEMPDTPSDWARTYSFFPDGTYEFRTNRMLCGRRLLSISGHWSHKERILTLTQLEQVQRVGGRLEPAAGSCADKYELTGAETVSEKITPPKIETIVLKDIQEDKRFTEMWSKTIHINGQQYWKYSDNPKQQY